ncbi:hypothetical protein WG66_003722 [Moniliophthora roreri]|nr:hypothetical protein WG66_003722 [Moniliophthora roreri]
MKLSLFLLCLFHLATAIVLPSVNDWARGGIESLYKAISPVLGGDNSRFNNAFDGIISKGATDFTWNGARISRDEYRQNFISQAAFATDVKVTFLNVVAVADDNGPLWSGGVGEVGLFYNLTITTSDSLRLPATITNYQASINLRVAEGVPPPPVVDGIRGYFDGRRVVQVNHIVARTGTTKD